jgi:O-antigen ligase
VKTAGLLLAGLLVLLPFEPRRPTLPMFGVEITLLEAAAALVTLACAIAARGRLTLRGRGPVVALLVYAAVHVISALTTPHHPELAWRFSLRMAAMALFAVVVSALPADVRRRGFAALAAGSAVVAVLAIAEALGASALDPVLGFFREAPVTVAGVRRATAGSEHPNLAAAFLMYGVLAAVGTWSRSRPGVALGLSLLGAAGLAATYSRGAAAAALVGLLVLAAREREGRAVAMWAAAVVLPALVASVWRPAVPYDVRYEPADAMLRLAPGERRTVAVGVTNAGRGQWAEKELALSCHWLREGADATEDGPLWVLAPPAPGQTVVARVEIVAPARPGSYRLVWDLVRADGTWLSGEGVPPAVVDAAVGDVAPPRPLSGPLVWQPHRAELWRLALLLWRQRPLLGVGPDNYRRRYGPAAGRSFWDDRVYANNTLLEAAATTGTLGAAALAAALGLTLWRAARGVSSESAVVFALGVAIAVHGLTDYVLAMTGHYLMMGWLVGTASAPESGANTASSAA